MYAMSACDAVHRPPGCGIAQVGVFAAGGLGRIDATSNAGAESVTGTCCSTSSVLASNSTASAHRPKWLGSGMACSNRDSAWFCEGVKESSTCAVLQPLRRDR
jgi:hypothetical protein